MTFSQDPFAPSAAVKPVKGKAAAPTDAAPQPEPAAELSPATGEQAQAPAAPTNGVPQGTVGDIMDWVGDDKERAQAALDAENATGDARKSLVKKLEEKLETEPAPAEAPAAGQQAE